MAWLVTVLALSIAAAIGATTSSRLALSLGLAWLLVELGLRTRIGPRIKAIAKEGRALLALGAIVPSLVLGARASTFAENEGLYELAPRLRDRARLARSVAIAPPLVVAGQRQSFFVRAEGAGTVRVAFEGPELEAQALGHGVFRVDLEPTAELAARASGAITITISVDGADHAETVPFVRPLAHPRRPHVRADDGAFCVVSEETNELFLGTAGSLEALEVVRVPGAPVACAIDGPRVWLALREEARLRSLSFEGDHAIEDGPEIGRGAIAMALSPRGGTLAIVRSGEARELVRVRLAEGHVDHVALEGVPLEVAFADDDVVVATRSPARLEVVDAAGQRLARRELVMPAATLAVTPEGEVVIATGAFDEAGRDNLGNHFVEDQLVWLERASLTPRRIEVTARRTDRQDHAGDADRGLSPLSLAFDREGDLFVAFVGSSELGVYPRTAPPRWRDLGDHVFGPAGVAISGDRVLVTSAIDGALVTLDRRSLEVLAERPLAPTDAELLHDAPSMLRLRMGERSYFEGTRAGASCQSCHLGVPTDGEAHNIGGRVLAPTLDVRGLAGTAPFLRDGSYPHLGDLYEVAVAEYRGYRAPAGDRHATLEAYLEALPLPASLGPRDVVREQRGLDAFVRAGCDRCHAPPAFTTLARYPLHTVFPDVADDPALSFDVPALRNLRDNEPYLYDGRAARLLDVLGEENRPNRHGDTRALSDDDRGDLVFFLESL
ncbi:MAG: hypothetical protein U0353_24385 [Sandaracinus sp.]